MTNWTPGQLGQQSQLKPIKANKSQYYAKTNPNFETTKTNANLFAKMDYEGYAILGSAKTNPTCSELACPACPERSRREPVERSPVEGVEPIQTQLVAA
jgi:hypothetical protein